MTLRERLKSRMADTEAQLDEVTSAMPCVYSLGLAYDDSNSKNLAVNKRDEPSLVDIGPSQAIGHALFTASTRMDGSHFMIVELRYDKVDCIKL